MVCALPTFFMIIIGMKEVCYKFEGTSIGCFDKSPPFENTPCLPEKPRKLNIEFLLFTQASPSTPTPVTLADIGSLVTSKPTKFILHGYQGRCDSGWIGRMKDELLANDDYNVFCVDYSEAADFTYEQAVANARVVGACLSVFIDELASQVGISASDVHLIGHSLGAQTAGYAGQGRISPLGRISGLDPSGPRFKNEDPLVRLDPSDAMFVDVIHTDGLDAANPLGLGILQASGHADFYPNLGRNQPGCLSLLQITAAILAKSLTDPAEIALVAICDHTRAYEYYIESINSGCAFTATACSLADADDGTCPACGDANCTSMMGFDADLNTAPATYFLTTNAVPPFCVQ